MAWRTGESLVAAMHLLEAVRSPTFQRHEAFPEAQYYLAVALLDLGMEGIARPLLAHALTAGERSRQYKSILARFLGLSRPDSDPDRLDRWVDTYRRHWMGRPGYDAADYEIRYQLGKVYLQRGRPDVARQLLAAIPETDPHYLRARHVLAVSLVALNIWDQAALAFEDVARAARARADALQRARVKKAALSRKGSDRKPVVAKTTRWANVREPVVRYVESHRHPAWKEAEAPDAEETQVRAVCQQAALARARLAMAEEDYETAWRWYRRLPPGSRDYLDAADEGVWALTRHGRFARAERAAAVFIATSPTGLTAGRARLLRAFLVVEAGEFERGEELFVEAMAHFELAVPEIEQAGEGLVVTADDQLAFDPNVAAWSEPGQLGVATRGVALLNSRLEELGSTRALVAMLSKAAADPSHMPAVESALVKSDALRRRVDHVREIAEQLRGRGCPTGCPPTPAGSAGDLPRPKRFGARLEAVEAWVRSLDDHLDRYEASVVEQSGRQAAEVKRVVEEETRRLQTVQSEADALRNGALAAAKRLASQAKERAIDLALRAEIGLADVSYRRKEKLSKRIEELYAKRKAHLAEVARANREAEATAAAEKARREVAYPAGVAPSSGEPPETEEK